MLLPRGRHRFHACPQLLHLLRTGPADLNGQPARFEDLAHQIRTRSLSSSQSASPGCTNQACGLRDIASELGDTAIVGISPDLPEKQANFDQKYTLGYPLLSDPEHTTAEAYGVWGEKKLYGRAFMGIIRSAFLIDEKGKVAEAWYKISPKDTPIKLLKALDASA